LRPIVSTARVEAMIVSRRALLAQGWTDTNIRSETRAGELVRVAAGLYAPKTDLDGWPEVAYRVRVMAAAQRFQAVVSHASAAVVHGLPLGGADLSAVHLIRPGKGGFRAGGDRTRHAGIVEPQWVTMVEGVRVTTAARTVVDLARSQPVKTAVSAMDNALFRRLCTPEDIRRAMTSIYRPLRGSRRRRVSRTGGDVGVRRSRGTYVLRPPLTIW